MGTVTSLSNGNLVHFGDLRSSIFFILVTVTLYNYTTTVTTEIITTTTIIFGKRTMCYSLVNSLRKYVSNPGYTENTVLSPENNFAWFCSLGAKHF